MCVEWIQPHTNIVTSAQCCVATFSVAAVVAATAKATARPRPKNDDRTFTATR